MGVIINPNKEYFDSISVGMESICKPLARFGICYFIYARLFDDNTTSALVTHGESLYHHLKNEYPVCPHLPKNFQGKKVHYMPSFSNIITKKQEIDDYRDLFNIHHPIFFIERHTHYTEFCCYGADSPNIEIINFYLSNIDILEKFKLYFRDTARNLLKYSEENKLLISEKMVSWFDKKASVDGNNKQRILQELRPRHRVLLLDGDDIFLTRRELDVLEYISKGCTLKEVARYLTLSSRTIENYFDNIKLKIGSRRKSEIIKIVSDAGLL